MLIDVAAYPIALDQVVSTAFNRNAARLHVLQLAVAHARQVGTDDVAGRLQHLLFMWQAVRVETLPPRQAGIGIEGDRGIHAADLGSHLTRHLVQHPHGRGGTTEVPRLRTADLKAHQPEIIRVAFLNIGDTAGGVWTALPDWHAPPFRPAGLEPGTKTVAKPFVAGSARILGNDLGSTGFKAIQLFARREDIRGEDIDVSHRPVEQRADDRLGDPRRGVLRARPAPTADITCRAPAPGQEGNATPGHPWPEMMEVDGDIDIEADLLR
ncbi:hypothetical protein SCH4B_4756 [Ruegeria sp. TrichCH4B]|nr:hypothetical protein SCH4B_4756 [Ruegeria sp. TrichCH4B]